MALKAMLPRDCLASSSNLPLFDRAAAPRKGKTLKGTGMKRTILITGCSSGIGLDAARGLHQRGWRVFATCRQEPDCERLRAEGLESFVLDYADEASIEAAVAEVVARTGGPIDAFGHSMGGHGALTLAQRERVEEAIDELVAAVGADPRFADAYRLQNQAWVDSLVSGTSSPLATWLKIAMTWCSSSAPHLSRRSSSESTTSSGQLMTTCLTRSSSSRASS